MKENQPVRVGPEDLKAMTAEMSEHTILQIAEMTYWANKAYCHMQGDHSIPKWEDAEDWRKDSNINGVRFHLANPHATPEDSHENWCRVKLEDGWKYSPTKDADKKEHPCLVTYKELPYEQQVKDSIFQGIVHSMVAKAVEAGKLTVDRPLTDGEDVMNIQFNPGGSPSVNRIKRAFADLHDLCVKEADAHRLVILNRENKQRGDSFKSDAPMSSKKANQCGRLMALALTNIETAQMWAVKSVTR